MRPSSLSKHDRNHRDLSLADHGHIGCCDQSPSQHGSKHAAAENHPIIRSFEPDEDWFYDFNQDEYAEGPELAPPLHHPLSQPTPGPAGRVPRDWEQRLN
jgi:hypothetical protein